MHNFSGIWIKIDQTHNFEHFAQISKNSKTIDLLMISLTIQTPLFIWNVLTRNEK